MNLGINFRRHYWNAIDIQRRQSILGYWNILKENMLSEGSSVWSPQKKIIKEQEYIRVISGPSKERDMYLMAASDNHSQMALTIMIIFPIALLTSNILMIPALHKGFITVIRMYWPADKNILDLWKFYFTWMNTSAICFID